MNSLLRGTGKNLHRYLLLLLVLLQVLLPVGKLNCASHINHLRSSSFVSEFFLLSSTCSGFGKRCLRATTGKGSELFLRCLESPVVVVLHC